MASSKESTFFPVGTILVDLGRYGSDVVLFYQVVRCTEKTVWYKQIRSHTVSYNTAVLERKLMPMPSIFHNHPRIKTHMARILQDGRHYYVKSPEGAEMYKWDGQPVTESYTY